MKDRRGTLVDPGIKKIVAALKMHEVNTAASCEGHMDHGFPYPWVDVDGRNEMLKLTDLVEKFNAWLKPVQIFPLQIIPMGYYKDNARLQTPNFDMKNILSLEKNETILLYLRGQMNIFADYLINNQ